MVCRKSCLDCKRLIITDAVAYGLNGLIMTLKSGIYKSGYFYCIMVARRSEAAADANVFIKIENGGNIYDLTYKNGEQVKAADIHQRNLYRVKADAERARFILYKRTRRSDAPQIITGKE